MLINTLYFINSLFFNFCIAFYLMSALQWYSCPLYSLVSVAEYTG
ncbi:hypothetical protein ACISOT_08565, partial [Campylobacter jejuni]